MRKHLTYANVMVTLLAIGALTGGVAYAANTVFSTDIVDGEVKTADLAGNAVRSTKILDGQVTAADLAPAEPWHAIRAGSATSDFCAAGKLAVFCSAAGLGGDVLPWKNYGNGYAPAGYYKDQLGIVHLKGLVLNVLGFAPFDGPETPKIFRLPPAYRPDNARVFVITGDGTGGWFVAPGRIDVDPAGWVTFVADCDAAGNVCSSDGDNYVSLDGISFRPDE